MFKRLLSPVQRFLEVEAAGGIVLVIATAIAVAWANSPWASSYRALWRGDLLFAIDDVLMTIFFFVVGMELRRERPTALPFFAALGGMLVPAAIYAAINAGRAGAAGWGVPMATDIAFAVGVLTLLGARVAPGVRVLLLGLAVIDDVGAIIVIACFYSAGVGALGLAIAGGALAAIAVLAWRRVDAALAYVVPGVALWIGLHHGGVHPTLAGVALGLAMPARTPSLEHALHRGVAFGIMPLFALANAGVAWDGASLSGDAAFVFVGIAAGLALGKPLGIVAACRLAKAELPARGLAVMGAVAGIGFTMSIFIAQLAFPPGPLLATAKLAILAGSLVAALIGLAAGAILTRS